MSVFIKIFHFFINLHIWTMGILLRKFLAPLRICISNWDHHLGWPEPTRSMDTCQSQYMYISSYEDELDVCPWSIGSQLADQSNKLIVTSVRSESSSQMSDTVDNSSHVYRVSDGLYITLNSSILRSTRSLTRDRIAMERFQSYGMSLRHPIRNLKITSYCDLILFFIIIHLFSYFYYFYHIY